MLFRQADKLAQEHTEKAINTIVEIMDDPFADNKDRLNAANQILDRGHGKPLSATIALPMNRQQAAALAAMSDDELMAAVNGAALPKLVPSGNNQHRPTATDRRFKAFEAIKSELPVEDEFPFARDPLLD